MAFQRKVCSSQFSAKAPAAELKLTANFKGQMFVKSQKYRPCFDYSFGEGVTALLSKDGKTWVGMGDGILVLYGDKTEHSKRVFEKEFDYLENEVIKPKVTAIEHMNDGSVNDIVYLGNEKSIKVLKIRNDTSTIDICNGSYVRDYRSEEAQKCANIHSYILNSLSINRSREYLISSDYVKINLWKPERMESFYNIVDLKPQLTGGTVFVINSCKFDPFCDNLFAYSSSSGEIYVNDISISPKSQNICTMKNPSTDSVKSISDFSFIESHLIVSRSLNNVCLFDIRNTEAPIFSRELLSGYYEKNKLNSSSAIYEKFKIASNSVFAYTGSYCGSVYCINILSNTMDEVPVAGSKDFDLDLGIKLLSCDDTGFTCIYSEEALKFVRED